MLGAAVAQPNQPLNDVEHWREKDPKIVTPNMPQKTAVPSVRRISAPAPIEITSGTTPRMKANDVIMIGRKRSSHAYTQPRLRLRGKPLRPKVLALMREAIMPVRPDLAVRLLGGRSLMVLAR